MSVEDEKKYSLISTADTGINSKRIVNETYTGKTEGNTYTLESLSYDLGDGDLVDSTELIKTIAKAEKIDKPKYADTSVDVLEDALKRAKEALITDSQMDVDSAKAVLDAPIDALVEKSLYSFQFDDVSDNKQFYYEAVYWAVDKKITKGTSEKLFSPDTGCTRAQVVTFLWRVAGEPKYTFDGYDFFDVRSDSYYDKAVQWAVEQNITKSTSYATFSPDSTCTRAQIVTFLYHAAESPKLSGKKNPFKDVAEGEYYTDAVAWAAENGITIGKSADTFAPNDICTRAEVVTFLYRSFSE